MPYLYSTDHLGSVRAVRNALTGAVVSRSDYEPYGAHTTLSGTPQRYRYNGKEDQSFAGTPYLDYGARQYDPAIGRWMVPDPLAEKYYSVSPYVFCLGNPINKLDLDGYDIWELDGKGFVRRITDKTQDAIYLVKQDEEGNYVRRLENGVDVGIQFEYGTIEEQKAITFSRDGKTIQSSDVFQVRGDDNALALFEFFANNVSANELIEYSLIRTGKKGDSGLNFITTSYEMYKEKGADLLFRGQLKDGYFIREITHTHPKSISPSESDYNFKNTISKWAKRQHFKTPYFFIYYVNKNDPDKYGTTTVY